MLTLKTPAILDGVIRKKDNSYSLRFVTGLESDKVERDIIDDLFQKEGWLIFCDMNDHDVVIPTTKPETGRKSPSEILYARMYVAYDYRKKQGKTTQDFDTWRKSQLEAIGQQYLNEIKD